MCAEAVPRCLLDRSVDLRNRSSQDRSTDTIPSMQLTRLATVSTSNRRRSMDLTRCFGYPIQWRLLPKEIWVLPRRFINTRTITCITPQLGWCRLREFRAGWLTVSMAPQRRILYRCQSQPNSSASHLYSVLQHLPDFQGAPRFSAPCQLPNLLRVSKIQFSRQHSLGVCFEELAVPHSVGEHEGEVDAMRRPVVAGHGDSIGE